MAECTSGLTILVGRSWSCLFPLLLISWTCILTILLQFGLMFRRKATRIELGSEDLEEYEVMKRAPPRPLPTRPEGEEPPSRIPSLQDDNAPQAPQRTQQPQ